MFLHPASTLSIGVRTTGNGGRVGVGGGGEGGIRVGHSRLGPAPCGSSDYAREHERSPGSLFCTHTHLQPANRSQAVPKGLPSPACLKIEGRAGWEGTELLLSISKAAKLPDSEIARTQHRASLSCSHASSGAWLARLLEQISTGVPFRLPWPLGARAPHTVGASLTCHIPWHTADQRQPIRRPWAAPGQVQ